MINMKAVVEDVRSGHVEVVEVPYPELHSNGILVRTRFSAVSAGTERAKLETGGKSLVGKALARPDLVRQVLDVARQQGIQAAYHKVQSRLNALSALGYSCAGTVLAVGEEVTEFQPGDRVSCAGAGYANHCEVNFIPGNLAVRVPDNVPLDAASLTTIGAIALQGLRQSDVRLGETVAVIGTGLVGLLALQLSKAAGCRTLALDIDEQRVEVARRMGADLALLCQDAQTLAAQHISRYGADAAIITAASRSAEPLELAARLLRDRGRIVVVGDVGMGISRRAAYHKELSIALSRSYGPGRYDAQYEEKGVDYPIGYVRWTEKRNMEAFLDLLASGSLNVAPLLELRYPVHRAQEAYTLIRERKAYTVILEYPDSGDSIASAVASAVGSVARDCNQGQLYVSCIGAGAFARDVALPHMRSAKNVILDSVATSSGISAETARRSFGFRRTLTVEEALVFDSDLLCVLSRHDSHSRYVTRALINHKAVFVEKPLATSELELQEVRAAYEAQLEQGHAPFLMVGFNRRFAPFTERIKKFFADRREPMLLHARVNAGYLPLDHWTHEAGGRIVGECCHFVDWARSVVNSPIKHVQAAALPDGNRYCRDNVVVTLSFEDQSLANLLYLANGDNSVSKEYFEVFCGGMVARMDDFRFLTLVRHGKAEEVKAKRDKGHSQLFGLTLDALRSGRPAPIAFDELFEVTQATFTIHRCIAGSRTDELSEQTDPDAALALERS